MAKLNLTDKEIKECAQAHEIGNDVFINLRTKEIIELPNILNGPMIEFNEYHTDDIEKIESNWHDIIKLESPNSNESFEIMSEFVNNLQESQLKENLANALNRNKPFKQFNNIIHNCEQREKWFEYKSKKLKERVIKFLSEL